MTLQELINPWAALKRAKLDVVMLRREVAIVRQDIAKLAVNNTKLLSELKAYKAYKAKKKKEAVK
jgi:hypothetical protein